MGKSKSIRQVGLCFRCEHRALWHETEGKYQPRCECGDVNRSSYGCYMYKPVKPVTLTAYQKDRPFIPGMTMITARMSGTIDDRDKDFELHCEVIGRKKCKMYWKPVAKKLKNKM